MRVEILVSLSVVSQFCFPGPWADKLYFISLFSIRVARVDVSVI